MKRKNLLELELTIPSINLLDSRTLLGGDGYRYTLVDAETGTLIWDDGQLSGVEIIDEPKEGNDPPIDDDQQDGDDDLGNNDYDNDDYDNEDHDNEDHDNDDGDHDYGYDEHDGDDEHDEPADTSTIAPLYGNDSSLTTSQKEALNTAMVKFTANPVYNQLYNYLISQGITIDFHIGQVPNGSLASYNQNTGDITFENEANITSDNLTEELIHAVQHSEYGSDFAPSVKNYEYEAKVFQDLANIRNGTASHFLGIPSVGNDAGEEYMSWILHFVDNPSFEQSDVEKFNDFCSKWTVYEGTLDSSFTPEILLEYIK